MSEEKKSTDPAKEKKKIRSAKAMRQLMTDYYTKAKIAESDGSKKIAWITSGGPVEPLHAMDVIPIYPENHGAMLGASKMSVEMCQVAEDMGYSRDLCSYFRGDIGSAVTKESPIPGGLPKPDFLVACNNICGTVTKWYEVLSRYFDVPMFLIDTPFIHQNKTTQSAAYVTSQMQEYINFLEEQCGASFDMDRFEEVAHLSMEGVRLWNQVLSTCENSPSPISCFDAFFFLGPIVTLRGTEENNEFYRGLLTELEERVADGIAAVDNEKYRLLWDNLPIWFRVRKLSNLLAARGVALVASTYTNAWGELAPMMDPQNPLESSARVYLHPILNRGTGHKLETIRQMVKDYQADGVILHSDRSCKPYSVGQMDQRERLAQELDVPALLLEADHNDPRSYSDEQGETRLDAFMEVLGV